MSWPQPRSWSAPNLPPAAAILRPYLGTAPNDWAASPGLFQAVRAELRTGALIDEAHSVRGESVAVLGPNAAQRLGIDRVEDLPALRIGDELYLVIGILDGVARQPDLLGAVIIPEGTARRRYRSKHPGLVVVEPTSAPTASFPARSR